MRLFTALTITALLLVAGCGGDEPEPPPQQNPQPAQQQPAPEPEPQQPAPEPEPEPEPEPAPPAMDQDLYTVQVAAFTNQATANEWAGRLRSQDLPVWTSVAEIGGATYHRLRVGALPSVSDTRRLADMLSQRYHWPVWVAPLTPADRLPVNAVRNTRMLLRGG